MNNSKQNFYRLSDYSNRELEQLVTRALQYKNGNMNRKPLENRELLLLFFNPSLRTRISYEIGMRKLGGNSTTIDMQGKSVYGFEFETGIRMDGETAEHVKEAAGVLSRYGDALAIRASELITSGLESGSFLSPEERREDRIFRSFMEHSSVPIINMESNRYHPSQGLGDMLTIHERIPDPAGEPFLLTWTYHPKALPLATPHSQALAAASLGMNVKLAHPEGWELDPDVMETLRARAKQHDASVDVVHDMDKGFENTRMVCAKSWGGLNGFSDAEEEREKRKKHTDWIVNEERMSLTDDAYFMHCLPVRRNVVVTDGVLDSKQSIVLDQAENRMWAQMALLFRLMN